MPLPLTGHRGIRPILFSLTEEQKAAFLQTSGQKQLPKGSMIITASDRQIKQADQMQTDQRQLIRQEDRTSSRRQVLHPAPDSCIKESRIRVTDLERKPS